MINNPLIQRIVIDPEVLSGKPIIQGTRLSVQYILGLLASGADTKEILLEYKGLTHDDILACFLFASTSLDNNTFTPLAMQTA